MKLLKFEAQNKKIVHKPRNKAQSLKHKKASVVLQAMFQQIKLIGKEVKISEIETQLEPMGIPIQMSIITTTQNKETNNLTKRLNLKPP
jgi:hypothetical protein